jgi:hypothetical protein
LAVQELRSEYLILNKGGIEKINQSSKCKTGHKGTEKDSLRAENGVKKVAGKISIEKVLKNPCQSKRCCGRIK